MKVIKNFSFKKLVSFLLVFALIFSQNSMFVFADTLSKSRMKLSNNLNTQINDDKNKSKQNNYKNSEELTQNEILPKGYSNEKELKKEYEITKNDSNGNSMELEKIQAGSYTINEYGVTPFTGDWGEKYTFESEKSNDSKNILKKQVSTYENPKGRFYYKQLNSNRKRAYDIYEWLLRHLDQDQFLDVCSCNLNQADFYAVYDVVTHENPELFWGYDMTLCIDQTGRVTKVKYNTPFTPRELEDMIDRFYEGLRDAINEIYSDLGENPSKLKKVRAIHDYLVSNNHYGTAPCPEEAPPNGTHRQCKGFYIEHTPYGALVKSDNYGVVCEGLTGAFTLLCECFDIEVTFDAGWTASHTILHECNYVKMEDDKWYIVDLTYDNAYMKEHGVVYEVFLSGTNNSNFQFEHDEYLGFPMNMHYKLQTYSRPEISENSYVKFEVIYPVQSKFSRNVFANFSDLLNNLKLNNLPGNHIIILRDDYTLNQNEVKELYNYKVTKKQKFTMRSYRQVSGKQYTFNSSTKSIAFPVAVYLQNIIYAAESTFIGGDSIIVDKDVSTVGSNCSIYLIKQDKSYNEVYLTSGNWKNVVASYSPKLCSGDSETLYVTIEGAKIDNLTLSQGSTIKGDTYVRIIKNAEIKNFSYGNDIKLAEGKSLNIDISNATVDTFKKNTKPIYANTTINVTNSTVKNLVGPTVCGVSRGCTTTINIANSQVENVIGSDSNTNVNPNNDVVININIKNNENQYTDGISAKVNNKFIKSIKGSSSESVNSTININENITVGSITYFDNLIIKSSKKLNVNDELDYNKSNSTKKGIVTLSGNSTLKLPKSISRIGSLISNGESNKLTISKENAYLSINEEQRRLEKQVTIKYALGLYPKSEDELIRFKNRDNIYLNDFINGISNRFQLYDDDSTYSIRLISSEYPIKVEGKDRKEYKCSCLYDALDYIQKKVDPNFSEVEFYINENYEMSKQDLEKLKSYSSTITNQKLVFTSEKQSLALSTCDDVILPTNDKLLGIEFKNITLDFENKNIFASGTHLIMGKTVKMTLRSKINIYGGSFEKNVKNSKLTLNGGTFNNVYGGGSSLNGTVLNNIDISLDEKVLVEGSVYGGSDTGSNETTGTTTINLLGGVVIGDIIGGGQNASSSIFNKIVINCGNSNSKGTTYVRNIYGLSQPLSTCIANKSIEININKDVNLNKLVGFSNLNIKQGVTLKVSKILKYNGGISNSVNGKVKLYGGSSLYIPNSYYDYDREIGKLESVGFNNNIYIDKGKYLVIDSNTNPTIGSTVNILYYNGSPELGDKLVKLYDEQLALTSKENFKTSYKFNISSDKTGYLYLFKKIYEVSLYTDSNTLYKTDEITENRDYTFEAPPKIKGKEFIAWKNTDKDEFYVVGQKIRVTEDMSVVAEYRDVEEYTVTLKVDGLPYKVDYVQAGKSYTFTAAPPIPEKYFIGWEPEETPSNNLYSTSLSMMKSITHIQPGTTISVNRDLTFDADYGNEVKYDIDYDNGNDNENGKVHEVYYDGGTIKVPSTPPTGITIPFGKIFAGFRVIFNGIGNIVGGIVNTIFRPGQSITIKPGIKIEAVWVDELTVNLYDENGNIYKTEKIGKGLEYTLPIAPEKEYKEFLYWQNKSNPNDIYNQNDKITVDTDLNLKPVYKNNKIISLCLDSKQPKYFANFTSALNYAENNAAKVARFEFLEDYALTDPDIEKLMNFSKNNVNFIIRGCNEGIKLRIEKSIKLPTDTTFENIVLNYVSNNNQAIYARGHKLEMGDNITMKGIGAPILIGGDDETNVSQSKIIVKSGTYSAIYGGGYSEYSVVNGDTTIELLGGEVLGDIYGGSQNRDLNNSLTRRGTTNIKLSGGIVGGVVSGTSKFLGLGNSNDVNIYLQGTELKKGEVYGGYVDPEPVSHNTGVTTITVGENYDLNNLLGFRKLDIKQGVSLEVKKALSHIGGIKLIDVNGEICLNGNSKLIVPSTEYDEYRQAGWINSKGSNNEIRVNKGQYLSLTSTKDDEIDSNTSRVILDFKIPDTSKDISVLLKYTENKEKAKSKRFKKGPNIQSELVLKGDKENGVIYSDERNLIKIIDPNEKSRGFKTMKGAIESIKSDSPKGEYTVKLLENYTLTDPDISALKNLNRSDVNFVITGVNETTNSNAELNVSNSIMLSADTKFENIVFNYGASTGHGIYARGHKLEMGKNIDMKGTGAPILLGGENKKNVDKSEIVVESGTYSSIYGGGYEEYSGVHGDITIELRDGEVRGDIYAGSQNTGLISCGKTEIKLSGGTVGGVVSGASRLLGLENSNNVNIYLQGTALSQVYGGYSEEIEDSHNTGRATITVEKDYILSKLLGFTKLDIKQGVWLELKKVLNHKGGIRVTDESGEVCLNGNSTLIAPASHNPSEIQIGWLNSKEQNNKIFVYKDMYLSLTSERSDIINMPIELGFKNNTEGITKKSILLKYETNKQKAHINLKKFVKGIYLPDDVIIKSDDLDGSIYIEEDMY